MGGGGAIVLLMGERGGVAEGEAAGCSWTTTSTRRGSASPRESMRGGEVSSFGLLGEEEEAAEVVLVEATCSRTVSVEVEISNDVLAVSSSSTISSSSRD
jgi:hypothetical protein